MEKICLGENVKSSCQNAGVMVLSEWKVNIRGRSSDGRMFDWQSKGRGFDSHRLHQSGAPVRKLRTGAFFILELICLLNLTWSFLLYYTQRSYNTHSLLTIYSICVNIFKILYDISIFFTQTNNWILSNDVV